MDTETLAELLREAGKKPRRAPSLIFFFDLPSNHLEGFDISTVKSIVRDHSANMAYMANSRDPRQTIRISWSPGDTHVLFRISSPFVPREHRALRLRGYRIGFGVDTVSLEDPGDGSPLQAKVGLSFFHRYDFNSLLCFTCNWRPGK